MIRSIRTRLGALTMNPAAVDALASAIQTQEGYYPGSVSYRNNNPGNLVYAGQPGASQGVGGFASFSSYDLGDAALKNQINLDATRGTDVNGNPVTTVGELISSWAPESAGNNTAAYVSSVSSQTGYAASDSLLSLGNGSAPTSQTPAFSFSFPVADTGDTSSTDPSTLDASSLPPASLAAIGMAAAAVLWLAFRS